MSECVGIHSDCRLWYSASSLSLYTMQTLSVLKRRKEQKRRKKITVQKGDATVLKCKAVEEGRRKSYGGEALLLEEQALKKCGLKLEAKPPAVMAHCIIF